MGIEKSNPDNNVAEYVESCEQNYDESVAMLRREWKSSGYHSTLPSGTEVHPTRTSFDYAIGLLRTGSTRYVDRSHRVLQACLALQEQDPTKPTFGIWPYTLEESLDEMSPPDWNWADFCGAGIALILHDHAKILDIGLVNELQRALEMAAYSIFRRNVQSGYTNIAIMGAGVCAAAGEMLGIPFLLDYGRQRLSRFVEHTEHHGGFNEYNSPTYTVVALEEAERILHVVRDVDCRDRAEWIRREAWQMIGEHFHPATHQWAGPHSRVYSDLLPPTTAKKIARRTGAVIRARDNNASVTRKEPIVPAFVRELECPDDLLPRFSRLPSTPTIANRRFIRRVPESDSVVGYTWLSDDICLGSINHDSMWTQRRGLIGYWPISTDEVAVFRCRFLKDEKDFASAAIVNNQMNNYVLTGVTLWDGYGDWHIHLDRPTDGVFEGSSLLCRFSVTGSGANAEDLGGGVFRLSAGMHAVKLYTVPAIFDGRQVAWRHERANGVAWIEAVCHEGERMRFSIPELGRTSIVSGLQMIGPDLSSDSGVTDDNSPSLSDEKDCWTATWKPEAASHLSISVPTKSA